MPLPLDYLRRTVLLVLAGVGCAACDSDASREDTFAVTYAPPFIPAAMQGAVTNPFFPLAVGTVWTYEGATEDGTERIVVEVLPETREVAGVTATVVQDRVYLDGALIEDTHDWFAQDADGNVWYLGEETAEYEGGELVTTSGSWEAGIDGAEAGVLIPAVPAVGQAYYQEFYAGEAEDRGRVLNLNASVTVPYGTFSGCLETEDTTPLEPEVLEHKYYCPGVGTVLEVDLEEDTRIELIAVEKP